MRKKNDGNEEEKDNAGSKEFWEKADPSKICKYRAIIPSEG
jgi:hypothetical protein